MQWLFGPEDPVRLGAEGPPDAIRDDHRVIAAYLGREMKDDEVRAFLHSA